MVGKPSKGNPGGLFVSVALQANYKSHRVTQDGAFSLTFELGEHMANEVNDVYRLRDESLYLVVLTEAEYLANNQQGNSNGR